MSYPFNPNLTAPHHDSSIANQWWTGLSLYQQEFICQYYNIAIDNSPYTILLAYRNRNKTRALPGWPETCFTQI